MIDSAVAGAWPAGLAVSAALDDLQIDHLMLNADGSDRAGVPSARTRLRLNNPGWMNPMLGPHEPARQSTDDQHRRHGVAAKDFTGMGEG